MVEVDVVEVAVVEVGEVSFDLESFEAKVTWGAFPEKVATEVILMVAAMATRRQ